MKNILLIDDNEDDRALIETKFKIANLYSKIFMADTGEDGIKIANKIKPDIVIIDTNLPKLNGFQVCKKMREQYGDSIKIIMMTGYIDAVDAVEARRSGADDYSVKTFDAGKLIETVTQFI